MADLEPAPKKTKKGKTLLPLILGIVMMIAFGGGGFFSVYSGIILSDSGTGEFTHQKREHGVADDTKATGLPDIAFIPLDPLVINLGPASSNRHLRFRAELEVNSAYESDVIKIKPRILDALNTYLRTVDVSILEDPTALIRTRHHMVRRAKIVAGQGRVRNLLVTEFVVN